MMFLQVEEYVTKQVLIVTCLNLGHIANGYSLAWSSPALIKLLDKDQSPLSHAITSSEASWVASLHMVGILSGLYPRKRREGDQGELSQRSPNIRGIIMASTCVCHTFGILLVYCVGPFVSYRVVCYVIIVICVAHASSCGYFIPESPVFHVLKGKEEAAKRVLKELGRSKDIDTELRIMIEIHKQNKIDANCLQIFTIRSNRMALIIVTLIIVLNQGGGILCVLFYATMIFQSAASSVAPEIATIILGATQFSGSIVAPFFIDRYGRKTLLLLSTALCCVMLTVLGIYFYLELINHPSISTVRWLPLCVLVTYLFSFSFGLNVVPSLLLGELFQPSVRGLGSAISTTIGCFTGFVSTASFGFLVSAVGSHTTFWIFAVINFLGFLFTLYFVPETKGKSLMEIEAMLR